MSARVPVLSFILAGWIVFLGLGVGLNYDSSRGAVLWVVAGAVIVLNAVWMGAGSGKK